MSAKDTPTSPEPNMGARLARIESKLDRAIALFEAALPELQRIGVIDARLAAVEGELELRAVLAEPPAPPPPTALDAE